MSRVLAPLGDQSAIYQNYLGEVIPQRPEGVRQKNRDAGIPHSISTCYSDTDMDLPVSRSADVHRRNIEYVK